MRIAVVVSTWSGNPIDSLDRLLLTLKKYPEKLGYHMFLCANGSDYRLPAKLGDRFQAVFIRENVGFNMGAWDHAWRRLSDYSHFLFLQDDCYIVRKNWLSDFVQLFNRRPKCGLIGENYNQGWAYPWSLLTEKGETNEDGNSKRFSREMIARAQFYRRKIEGWGIDIGEHAGHVTTVVHFTSSEVLRKVDGYNIANGYQEAIASEIGFSKKVEALGYEILQIGNRKHSRIAHPQWPSNRFSAKLIRSIKKRNPFR